MNRARAFAKRALPTGTLPGFPLLWIAGAAAAALMTVTGGFRTGDLPLVDRVIFWGALVGFNLLKWQIWFVFAVRRPSDWPRASALGALPMTITLPFEISGALMLIGVRQLPNLFATWLTALVISIGIFTTMYTVRWWLTRHQRRAARIVEASAVDGLLVRARIAPDAVVAIEAEDHYCRVRARDGTSALVHYRFGDALEEIAGIEGVQVHRGSWVAAESVQGAVREGRRWMLVLGDGGHVAVSATYLPEVRARGWLQAPAA